MGFCTGLERCGLHSMVRGLLLVGYLAPVKIRKERMLGYKSAMPLNTLFISTAYICIIFLEHDILDDLCSGQFLISFWNSTEKSPQTSKDEEVILVCMCFKRNEL